MKHPQHETLSFTAKRLKREIQVAVGRDIKRILHWFKT